jgi:hypothetical protein
MVMSLILLRVAVAIPLYLGATTEIPNEPISNSVLFLTIPSPK